MSEANQNPSRSTLISQLLLEDADLREIVEEFVESLSERIVGLREAYGKLDWIALQTLSHQLKGAGGSYGYPDISQLAATIEQQVRQEDVREFERWIHELEDMARAARAGLEAE